MGNNLGLFAVGKKLVFVEGKEASIDRLTYHAIAQEYMPEAKITAAGSVENIIKLHSVSEEIKKSIFGIDLYMIRDRDCLSPDQIKEIEKSGRLKCLKRIHIENYFLDSEILFKVATKLYIMERLPELTQDKIECEMKKIAKSLLKLNLLTSIKAYIKLNSVFDIPTVKALEHKTYDEIRGAMMAGVKSSLDSLLSNLQDDKLIEFISEEMTRLESCLENGTWKAEFRGKEIFSKLCGDILKDDPLKIRHAYIDIALQDKPSVFEDIISIFKSFSANQKQVIQ